MDRQRTQLGRVFVICAALSAQVVIAPTVHARSADCCRDAAASCCRLVAADEHLAPRCPACTADDAAPPAESPCRCHLRARHDAAAGAGSRPLPDLERSARFADVTVRADSAESSAALLRLALVAGDAVPQRPPRILFGVWRN